MTCCFEYLNVFTRMFFILEDHPLLWRGQHIFCTIALLNCAVKLSIELSFAVLANVLSQVT